MRTVSTTGTMSPPTPPRWLTALTVVGFVLVIAAQVFGFLISPPDQDMGHLQKIMYVHVPAAMTAFMCFAVVFCGSAYYLWKGDERGEPPPPPATKSRAIPPPPAPRRRACSWRGGCNGEGGGGGHAASSPYGNGSECRVLL